MLGGAWPALVANHDVILSVLEREEAGFDRTLRAGLGRLEEAFATGDKVLGGDVAFTLHDTHGFPVELTEELARDAGVEVDRAGLRRRHDRAAHARPGRGRASPRSGTSPPTAACWRLRGRPTSSGGTRRTTRCRPAVAVGVLSGDGSGTSSRSSWTRPPSTPRAADRWGIPAHRHRDRPGRGLRHRLRAARADRPQGAGDGRDRGRARTRWPPSTCARREAIRRNHTATHLLHAALRTVLGDHVRQQGSLVAPDRLRFDFSHHGRPTPEELEEVFDLANEAVLTDDAGADHRDLARRGRAHGRAIAFFEDKYGATVRVIQAGDTSLEFCGGTHVDSLGQIGPISLVSEESIGSNKRRIFAVTGRRRPGRINAREHLVRSAADLLRTEPDELLATLERLAGPPARGRQGVARSCASSRASRWRRSWPRGRSTASWWRARTGRSPMRCGALAQAVLRHDGVQRVALAGSPDGAKVALVVATGGEPNATEVVRALGALIGGGGGGSAALALAGGRNAARIDEALAEARRLLSA